MKHLNTKQRYCIQTLLSQGTTQQTIADIIGVHKSTISRELRRNTVSKIYNSCIANKCALERHKLRRSYKLKPAVRMFIKERLAVKDSPEQIAVHIQRRFKMAISYECIYQYIYKDALAGGTQYQHLRWVNKSKRKRVNK